MRTSVNCLASDFIDCTLLARCDTTALLLHIPEPGSRKMDAGLLTDYPARANLSNLLRIFYDDVCKYASSRERHVAPFDPFAP
jgi:hypothetical protein